MYQDIDYLQVFKRREKKLAERKEIIETILAGFAFIFLFYVFIGLGSLIACMNGELGIVYMPFWHDPFLFLFGL
ncbi:MAG: hypothetical protein AAB488_01080 [Patescibacteria group bacterium]